MDYTKLLARLAEKSPCRKKFGVLIIYRNKIISKGFNYVVGNFSIHAEEAAIQNVRDKKILPKCLILLARLKDGCLIQCRCCPRCIERIRRVGMSKVYTS